ncbi:hypothetical protein [Chitinolyticbacter albus]|uniref:hypothetical protein n=1 Tax=Chitinolyticbacter albus TaxID=2961951 RepID=UPI00210B773B|nr:hypothetical protein [Chitinolyticbacter albus]
MYVFLLTFLLRMAADTIPDLTSIWRKLAVIVPIAILSALALFFINRYLTRQASLHLGLAAAVLVMIYYLIIVPWPLLLGNLFLLIGSGYGLLAVLIYAATPILLGAYLNEPVRR